ncbi:hypothetical protein [Ornithinimicrobium sp. INDO-MA30-4]|uniref:hypothetical protein n=1 Tax=Ornithinimicrobium sp. INDO-MA30-4 TaxID=2908651 RepID=UPI001F32BFB4|nr:hypothetical protein [Ornithinimicrobium sp. INDO-MA30-4]UJH71173.1 hypothetical protein L0A91_04880 [Ornithinimicrobium sp. INDO-MA30-4]
MVSSETSLSALMRRLSLEPFVFTVDGPDMAGFVTAADVGAVAVKTHFTCGLPTWKGF